AGRPQARGPPGDRRGLRLHHRAGRLQGPRRAAQPRRQPGHRPQRHGGARGRGLHHPPAHQRRAHPDRQGLPPVRRPAVHRQAALAGREARHPVLPRGRRRPRRRRAALGAAAGPAHPAGRGRAVPLAVAQLGAPSRDRPPRAAPPAAGPHHRHRAGGAAPARAAGGHERRRRRRPALGLRQPPARRAPRRRARGPVGPARRRSAGDPAGADERHDGGPGDPRRPAGGAHRARRNGQPDPPRARLPPDHPAGPGGARGAGGAAQAAGRGQRPHDRARQDRRGEQRGGTPVHLRGDHGLRPRRRGVRRPRRRRAHAHGLRRQHGPGARRRALRRRAAGGRV
ncbi:MAG: Heat-inducible transcription repressor HrcA, partial [uncultured Frankineae bacterium]